VGGFRVFLIVAGVCAVVGGGGIYFIATRFGPEVAGELDRARDEASAYGRGHDQNACVDETYRRLHACDGVLCEVRAAAFTLPCLKQASPAPGFCEGVPESLVEGVLWTKTACPDPDLRPQVCERVLRAILQTCYESRNP
jgi:hypothetical protein